MKNFLIMTIVALFITSGAVNAAGELWTSDFQAAKKEAAEKGKDLLLDFTGSDWCGWCIKLDKEVFSQDYFKTEAVKDFVFVTLDFPQDKSALSEATQKQNQALAEEFKIQGYPTIVLTTANGEAYAKTGYRENGPQDYVKHLRELKNTAGKAKNLIVAAAKETDKEKKAKLLDSAISGLDQATIDEYFKTVADDIIALDPENNLKLRNKYLLPKEIPALYEFVDDPATFDAKADELVERLKIEGEDLKLINDLKTEVKIQSEITKLAENQDDPQKLLDGIDQIIVKLNLNNEYKQHMMAQKAMIYLQLKDDLDSAIKAVEDAIAVDPESEISDQLKEFKEAILEEKQSREEALKEQIEIPVD